MNNSLLTLINLSISPLSLSLSLSLSLNIDLKYSKDHEWVRVEGDSAFVGITFHAQKQLGDIVFVELPAKDREVEEGGNVPSYSFFFFLFLFLSFSLLETEEEEEEELSFSLSTKLSNTLALGAIVIVGHNNIRLPWNRRVR